MNKVKRLRGSGSHGRGWRKSRHKGGSKGGVGRAGTRTHKRISRILEGKALERNRKTTCIRDLESKIQRYLKKGLMYMRDKTTFVATDKFYQKYKKILSTGEPSYKYVFDYSKIDVSAKAFEKFQ